MNLLNFIQQYPDEQACIEHFKAQREQNGIICTKCGSIEHRWLKNKLSYECKHCHSRQSLRSGTVMEHSKLPFSYWFVAMHLLTSTKKSFSSSELQRQLGHKRFQPIWEMMHKLRNVMTESAVVENPKPNKPPRKVNHIKMQVVDDLKADTAKKIVKEQVDYQSDIQSDDSTTYKKLNDVVKLHIAQVIKPEEIQKVLPWVHICISNVKRLLLDMYHQLRNEYLQYYLDEFCYKFNRRYFGENMFDRLVMVAVSYRTNFKSRIYNRTICG